MAYLKCLRNVSTTSIPDGSTVTPTDDIQTLLNCANIWDKSYTTLSELLADSTSLQAVISSNNAIDYLVRSTTWATDMCVDSTAMSYIGLNNYASNTLLADSTWCTAICNSTYFESVLNVKVPIMTSNNTPSGVCFASSENSGREAYHTFDGVPTEIWNSNEINTPVYVGYKFNSEVRLYLAVANFQYNNFVTSTTYKYQTSNDNSIYNDVSDSVTASGGVTTKTILTPSNAIYIRAYITAQTTSSSYIGQCNTLQFYGRADV